MEPMIGFERTTCSLRMAPYLLFFEHVTQFMIKRRHCERFSNVAKAVALEPSHPGIISGTMFRRRSVLPADPPPRRSTQPMLHKKKPLRGGEAERFRFAGLDHNSFAKKQCAYHFSTMFFDGITSFLLVLVRCRFTMIPASALRPKSETVVGSNKVLTSTEDGPFARSIRFSYR
jgi:hypothetical protein